MQWYLDRFEREYRQARDEYQRLQQLWYDVCWYNFEVEACKWKGPWRYSYPDSEVKLNSYRFDQYWQRGNLMESGSFPVYYSGPVCEAPPLPPDVVLHEMREAKRYMDICEQERSAPIDWAPGGVKYEALVRTTMVGKKCLYRKRKFSSVESEDGDPP